MDSGNLILTCRDKKENKIQDDWRDIIIQRSSLWLLPRFCIYESLSIYSKHTAKGYLACKKMRGKRCFCPAHNFQWMVKLWQTYPLPPSPYPMPFLFVSEKLYVTQIFRVGRQPNTTLCASRWHLKTQNSVGTCHKAIQGNLYIYYLNRLSTVYLQKGLY